MSRIRELREDEDEELQPIPHEKRRIPETYFDTFIRDESGAHSAGRNTGRSLAPARNHVASLEKSRATIPRSRMKQ